MISMLGQMPRLLPRAPVVTGVLRKPHLVFDIPPCSRGAKTPAKAKGGGKKGAAMVKPVLEVETDAHKLVNQVCGLNYKVDGDSEPVLIKADKEQDPNTKEYWLQVVRDMKRKRNRLMKVYNKK